MILDAQNLFSTAQALTATAASTNVIDLGVARDIGTTGFAPAPSVVAQVITAMLSGGSSTLTITVQGSTDNSTFDDMVSTRAIPKASLTAGALFSVKMPPLQIGQSLPRYLRLNYTVGTANFTDGTITAWLGLDVQRNRAYPAGNYVSN